MQMSDANTQDLFTAMTALSASIEGLTASKTSILSEMCTREHCHGLCIQEIHRAPHLARPMITGMILLVERPHIKCGSAILIRSNLKLKGVSVWEDNVELISIEMPGVVVHSMYKPPNEKFILPAFGYRNLPHIVIGDFNSHSTTWGYTTTDDNGEPVKQWTDLYNLTTKKQYASDPFNNSTIETIQMLDHEIPSSIYKC